MCRSRGIEVIVVDDANDPALAARIARMRADLLLTGAYPQIFREPLLSATLFPLNIHPSLLPRLRGANPIYWALATGAKETGATAHIMLSQVDAGPVLTQSAVAITDDDDYYALYAKVVRVVPGVVSAALSAAGRGERGIPQNEAEATSFREPRAADRRLDWPGSPARALWDRVRAGRAFTFLHSEPVEVVQARVDTQPPGDWKAATGGTFLMLGPDGPGVSTSQGLLFLTRVLFRGVYMDGWTFATAAGLRPGEKFT
ncbi:MAG: hypothetical protein HY713_02225 [candidate division NC10 bacterium]|nr:hypothetical protein [candidate division NC10 bacterium]